jgi:hypothetical protein
MEHDDSWTVATDPCVHGDAIRFDVLTSDVDWERYDTVNAFDDFHFFSSYESMFLCFLH